MKYLFIIYFLVIIFLIAPLSVCKEHKRVSESSLSLVNQGSQVSSRPEVVDLASTQSSLRKSHIIEEGISNNAFQLGEIKSTEGDDDNEETDTSTIVLLFMFFGLATGIILMQLFSKFGEAIPYTCAVFIMGLIFSAAASQHGTFGKSINQWVNIDADLMVFIFLPPLVFAEAMNLNWYHAKRGLLQSIILAGPGVILGAAFMGIATKYILPYDWNWNLAMVFGSILAATDTVAVVSLLKRVGAAPTLTMVIVGESLLNDGTAMVLFTVFYNSLNGATYTTGSIISFVFSAVVGSVVLGIVFGLVTVRWLRTANRPLKESDVLTQIAITICCAYLVFFLAQYVLEISGVLACVSAGSMLAWLAPPIILNHESMHNVWGMIEWALNTLIFLIAGLVIGHRVLGDVNILDWLYLLILYGVLMGVRAATITILYPFFSGIGHRCTKNGALFMSWAGLRGALGMALALLVEKNCPDDLKQETSRMFFFVGGIAALTLIINAATAKPVLYYLELVGTESAEKTLVIDQIKKKLRKKMDKIIIQMAKEFHFTENDLEEVRLSCTLLMDDVNVDTLYRDNSITGLVNATTGGGTGGGWSGTGGVSGRGTSMDRSWRVNNLLRNQQFSGGGDSHNNSFRQTTSTSFNSPLAHSNTRITPNTTPNTTTTSQQRTLSKIMSTKSVMIGDNGSDDGNDYLHESILDDDDDDDYHQHLGVTGTDDDNDAEVTLHFPRDSVGNSSNILSTSHQHGSRISVTSPPIDPIQQRRQSSTYNYMQSPGSISNNTSHRLQSFYSRQKSIHIAHMSRLLSLSKRGTNPVIIHELLIYVRAVFLEIVRVKYWHFIEVGKLPRQSFSAQFLLYTIEVGLDEVKHMSGARDWVCIDQEIHYNPFTIRLLTWITDILPGCSLRITLLNILARLKAIQEKRIVYMLTSFIEAHEHAQKKIHSFLGLDENEDDETQTPEEVKVINESQSAVSISPCYVYFMSYSLSHRWNMRKNNSIKLMKQQLQQFVVNKLLD